MAGDSTFAKIARFVHPFRYQLLGLAALTALIAVLSMLPPLLMRKVINDVIGTGDSSPLYGIIISYIALTALTPFCGYIQTFTMAYVGQSFVMRVRNAVYNHLLSLSMSFYSRMSTGKLLNRLMGDTGTLQQVLTTTSLQILSDLICALFAISVTVFINWRLSIPLYCLVVLFVINYRLKIGGVKKVLQARRKAEDRVAAGVQNRLVANQTVKTYGMEAHEDEVFRKESTVNTELFRQGQIATTLFSRNTELLRDVGNIVIFFLGCALVLNGEASYGDVTAFCTYSTMLLWPAVRFSAVAQQFQDVKISAERLFEILDEKPEISERENAETVKKCHGNVRFENVRFGYTEEKEVLKGISLDIEEGETVALVGSTGCGKSTILSLLMRMYDVTGGRITIDGRDVRDITLKSLHSFFGTVLQESLLFTVSIADNIRYGKPQASQKQVEFAARIAEIHKEILALPRGYESRVGDYDVQLSVGQKQRIAIARAILADPAILIMDEATSALDTNSEKAIQIALDRFLTGRTAFIVAHRLSTIRNADKIVFLDNGHIVECGPHEELMKIEGGRYRKLYETHAGAGMIEEGA